MLNITGGMRFDSISLILFYSVLLMLQNRPIEFRKAAPSGSEDILILVLGCSAKYYWRYEISLDFLILFYFVLLML